MFREGDRLMPLTTSTTTKLNTDTNTQILVRKTKPHRPSLPTKKYKPTSLSETPQFKLYNFAQIIGKACIRMEPYYRSKNLFVDIIEPNSFPKVEIDSDKIHAAFTYLLEDAITKAAHGSTITVSFSYNNITPSRSNNREMTCSITYINDKSTSATLNATDSVSIFPHAPSSIKACEHILASHHGEISLHTKQKDDLVECRFFIPHRQPKHH